MLRKAIWLGSLLLLALLSGACVAGGKSAQNTPAMGQGTYDGEWHAQAHALGGIDINLTFVIKDSTLQWMSYTYPGQAGQTCTALVAPDDLHALQGSQFTVAVPSKKETIFGTFQSPTTATGHISFVEAESARALNCVANVSAVWTGRRQAASATAPAANALISLCGVNVRCGPLLIQLLIFGLVNGAILALNAIGITVIYGTVRTINLAHGDVFALTTVLVTSTINLIGLDPSWNAGTRIPILIGVLVAAVVLGMLLSVAVEALAFRPFRGRSALAPVIASLGLSFILYQASLVWRAYQRSFIPGEHRSVPGLAEVPTDGIPNFLGAGNLLHGKVVLTFGDVFVFVAALLFVGLVTFVLFRTSLGRSIRATGQNSELARMVGVNEDAAIRRSFALGGALAGAAAFVFALYYARPFGQAGAESGLTAFAAALLGGIGSPVGALLSGLFIGITSSVSDYFLSAQWTPVLVAALLIALLMLQQGGLLGGEDATEGRAIRDLITPGSAADGQRNGRWLTLTFVAMALIPVADAIFHWGASFLLRSAGIFILLALSLNIVLGLSGMLDLGNAMAYAAGAYTAAILTSRYGQIDFSIVLAASAAVALLTGLIKGLLATRMRDDYLAVGTLVLGLMMQRVIVALPLTGGPNGFSSLPPPRLFGVQLGSPTAEYYLVLAVEVLMALLSVRLTSARTGRAWLALSDDDTAAGSVGINAGRYRLLAFLLASVIAGLAGALYASTFSYIDPNIAAFYVSALLLAMVILGGAGGATGVVFGALLIYAYDAVVIPQLSAVIAVVWPKNAHIGPVPNIRGANFLNFGIALYLTVLWRAARRKPVRLPAPTPIKTERVIPVHEK